VQSVKERQYILKSIKFIDEVIHYNTESELLSIIKRKDHEHHNQYVKPLKVQKSLFIFFSEADGQKIIMSLSNFVAGIHPHLKKGGL